MPELTMRSPGLRPDLDAEKIAARTAGADELLAHDQCPVLPFLPGFDSITYTESPYGALRPTWRG